MLSNLKQFPRLSTWGALEAAPPHKSDHDASRRQPFEEVRMATITQVDFLNCKYHNANFNDVVHVLEKHIATRSPGFMVSLNVNIAIRLDKDPDFRRAFEAADLVLMDSQPLVNIARRQGLPVKEKLSGSDLMPRICSVAASRGYSCFILGGVNNVPKEAARSLSTKFPGLAIEGYSPSFGFEKRKESLEAVLTLLKEKHVDILFLCLGAPKSEKLIYSNLDRLNIPFTFNVGAAVDFAAGSITRAPERVQRIGLEWLYRFSQEPSRLFRRYFVDSWEFLGIWLRSRRIR